MDRLHGQCGYCRQTAELVVARAAPHFGEEPCLAGEQGSGTVFFSGCALRCVYCQNYPIARAQAGEKITIGRLAEIFIELQAKGVHNINLVTPSHYAPQIVSAIDKAKGMGLYLPVVYNCGGYEKTETLRLLEGYVDIYLPDFKYMDKEIAGRYSNCADYADFAREAVKEMVRQAGRPLFDGSGMMTQGVMVRHLTLPGCLEDSKAVVKYLYEAFGNKIYISIMNQYTPFTTLERCPELKRRVTRQEYEELVEFSRSLGVENGFIQEGDTATKSFIPDFNGEGVEAKG